MEKIHAGDEISRASGELLSNMRSMRAILDEREGRGLNSLIDTKSIAVLAELENGKDFFCADGPADREGLVKWFSDLEGVVESIGQTPREKALVEDHDSLSSLMDSLQGIKGALRPLSAYLRKVTVNTPDAERAERLIASLMEVVIDRWNYLRRREVAIDAYLEV